MGIKDKMYVILIAVSTVLLSSCKSEYTRAVEKGLASEKIIDSLIFGMRIGQTKKDFYSICWELNKQQLISEGPGNMSAKYIEPLDSTKDKTLRKEMLFYGIFDENDNMYGMYMTYSYIAWAPWLKHLQSSALVDDLKSYYRVNYPGNDFIEFPLKELGINAFAKIDGNRQILIYPKDAKDVVVKIEDLRHTLKKNTIYKT